MDKLFAKIDDFNTTLWVETGFLFVVLSLVLAVGLKVF